MSMFPQSNWPEQNKPYRVKIYKRQRALLRNFIKVKGIDTRNQLHIQYKAYRNLIVFLIKKKQSLILLRILSVTFKENMEGIKQILSSRNKPPKSRLINNSLTSDSFWKVAYNTKCSIPFCSKFSPLSLIANILDIGSLTVNDFLQL